ncbi:hypothetical protein BDV11DRAFT_113108 [Aspergillus similis]
MIESWQRMTIAGPSRVKIRLVSTCIIDLSKMFVVAKGSVTGDAILYLQSHRFLSRAAHTTFLLAFSPLLLKPISLESPFIRRSVPYGLNPRLLHCYRPRVGRDIPPREHDSEPYHESKQKHGVVSACRNGHE